MENKQEATFSEVQGEIKMGENAYVTVVTHPAQRLNGKQIRTTAVESIGRQFGKVMVFTTRNTIYRRV